MYTAIKMKKKYGTHLECVIKYYSILNILSSLSWSKGDVNILSFVCVYGNIASMGIRKSFLDTFGMAPRSLDNSVRALLKKGFLIQEDDKITLNKQLHIEFETLILNIHVSSE